MTTPTVLFLHQKPTLELISLHLDRRALLTLACISKFLFVGIAAEKPIETSVRAYLQGYNLLAACYANKLDVVEYMHQNCDECEMRANKRFNFWPNQSHHRRCHLTDFLDAVEVSFICAAKRGYLDIVQFLYCHYSRFHDVCDVPFAAKRAKRSGHFRVAEWLDAQLK
jgi:hypothetical protein